MIGQDLTVFYEERLDEIAEYLKLLDQIEKAAQSGPPRIVDSSDPISASQQRILYSSVYLQLYNLVEATVSRCLDAISNATISGQWKPSDLTEEVLKEWVRHSARTHITLGPEKRLETAIEMCSRLMTSLPVATFKIEGGGGGNWDDESIEKVSTRVGCILQIAPNTRTAVKRNMRDDMGAMKLVKTRRNALAHGEVSFSECADGVTVSELRAVVEAVSQYLRETVTCFAAYVDTCEFLQPGRRPFPKANP